MKYQFSIKINVIADTYEKSIDSLLRYIRTKNYDTRILINGFKIEYPLEPPIYCNDHNLGNENHD